MFSKESLGFQLESSKLRKKTPDFQSGEVYNSYRSWMITFLLPKKIYLRLLTFLAVFIFLTFILTLKAAFAQTFNPTFSLNLVDKTAGLFSNISTVISQPAGDELIKNTIFYVPPGWDITEGSKIGQDEIVGNGTYQVTFSDGSKAYGDMTFLNDLKIREGDKAHWLLLFGPFKNPYLTLDVFVSGDVNSGHKIEIVRETDYPENIGVLPPDQFSFSFFGQTESKSSIFTNPVIAENYTWNVEMVTWSGLKATKSQIFKVPGSVTPTGSQVVVPLGSGISITFNSVTGEGVTTMTASETPPPQGTGQFQLDGLYYDFDTTATISCPCTITLPYDPATIKGKPRIYHLEGGKWIDVTTSFDEKAATVTGVVSSFSYFAVGSPDYQVEWDNSVERLLKKDGSPFVIKADDKLKIRFSLSDPAGKRFTSENVSLEIWQTKDKEGNDTGPNQVLNLSVESVGQNGRYHSELDLGESLLPLGTYQIKIVVKNTDAFQEIPAEFKISPVD